DRVDQPAKPTPEPFGPIDGFFGQPPGGRQQRRQLALKEAVHFEVGRTDRAVVVFYPAFQSVAAARPLLQRNLTGLAADVFEALTVYHRMPTGSLARALQARRAVLMPAASPFFRPTPEGALHHEHPRIPGQGTAGEVRYRRARRPRRSHRRGSGRGRKAPSRTALRGQSTDPCGRPWQGQVQGASGGGEGWRSPRQVD